jgi:hypothetical protein
VSLPCGHILNVVGHQPPTGASNVNIILKVLFLVRNVAI